MSTSTGHAIVGGLGHLGVRIAALLRERGYAVTAVALAVDDDARQAMEALGCRVQVGDIRTAPALDAAGLRETALCLFVTGDDRANLEAALTVHAYNPDLPVVLRLFDLQMARQVERALRVRALSASAIAAPAYVAAATDDDILAVIPVEDRRVQLYRAPLRDGVAGCDAIPLVLREGRLRLCPPGEAAYFALATDAQATACRSKPKRRAPRAGWGNPWSMLTGCWRNSAPITRNLIILFTAFLVLNVLVFSFFGKMNPLDAFYFVITTVSTVGYGDFNLQDMPPALKLFGVLTMVGGAALLATLYALIADRVLAARVEYLLGHRAVKDSGHTVILGLGNVGFRVAEDLAALGVTVVAVEAKADAPNVSAARGHYPVLIGDAGRTDVLLRAGLARADVLLAITDDPMINLSAALCAAEQRPGIKTIIRTYEVNLAAEFNSLGLFSALSTSAIAAPVFVDAALHPGVYGSLALDGVDLLVVRHRVAAGSLLAGRTPAALGTHEGLIVLAGVECNVVLQPGDELIVLLPRERLDILRGPAGSVPAAT